MLSMILSQPDSNEISFARLQDIAVTKLHLGSGLLTIHTHAALFDEPARVAAALCEPDLDQRRHEVVWIRDLALRHVLGHLAPAELPVEVRFSAGRCLLSLQAFHELARKRGLGVTRLHGEDSIELLTSQSGHKTQVFLSQRVGNRHRLAVDLFWRLGQSDVVAE